MTDYAVRFDDVRPAIRAPTTTPIRLGDIFIVLLLVVQHGLDRLGPPPCLRLWLACHVSSVIDAVDDGHWPSFIFILCLETSTVRHWVWRG